VILTEVETAFVGIFRTALSLLLTACSVAAEPVRAPNLFLGVTAARKRGTRHGFGLPFTLANLPAGPSRSGFVRLGVAVGRARGHISRAIALRKVSDGGIES